MDDTPNLPTLYLAGPWKRRDEVRVIRDQFVAAGFPVTSRWIDFDDSKATVSADNGLSAQDPAVMRTEAIQDIEDVLKASIVVVLNLERSEGKAVETGIAIAACKGIVIVGTERFNVFQYLDIPMVATPEEAIALCKNYPWKDGQQEIASGN